MRAVTRGEATQPGLCFAMSAAATSDASESDSEQALDLSRSIPSHVSPVRASESTNVKLMSLPFTLLPWTRSIELADWPGIQAQAVWQDAAPAGREGPRVA
jgi:hypothetical protein